MTIEIERKFLVTGHDWKQSDTAMHCLQGYLVDNDTCVVRARVMGDAGFLTVKGRVVGPVATEFEYGIDAHEAKTIIETLCDGRMVEKTRYVIDHAGMQWEVDEFHGANEGLIVAEVELDREDQTIDLPPWVGSEVTGDARYYNMNLAVRPYSTWHHEEKQP